MARDLIPPTKDEKQAAQRFTMLAFLRFSGVALAILGLVILGDRYHPFGEPSDTILGIALVLTGIFDVLIFPSLIARRWKTPDDQ